MNCDKCEQGLYYDAANTAYLCQYCNGTGVTPPDQCGLCSGIGKVRRLDEMDNSYYRANCVACNGTGKLIVTSGGQTLHQVDREGRLIRAAGDVMRAQRIKGIQKYQQTLEDQHGYTLLGMIDMTAEELADGSVYIQKVREQHMALLDELEGLVRDNSLGYDERVHSLQEIIKRERGNV